jgi:hypothetical protein
LLSSNACNLCRYAAAAAAALAGEVESKEARHARGAMARKAAYVTGIYIALAGFALMLRPAKVFGLLFSIEGITDAWIRVFG